MLSTEPTHLSTNFLIKGSKGEADKKCKMMLTPTETPDQSVNGLNAHSKEQNTGGAKRKRKPNKKLFGDFVSTANETEHSLSASGKKLNFGVSAYRL